MLGNEKLTLMVGKPFTPNSSAKALLGSSVASTLARVIPSAFKGFEALAYSGSNRLQCPHLHWQCYSVAVSRSDRLNGSTSGLPRGVEFCDYKVVLGQHVIEVL